MIIRIATEGQYELTGQALAELDAADNAMLDAIQHADAQAFARHLANVLDIVRSRGRRLDDRELKESDLVLPPPDITLEEARDLFAGYPRDLAP
ncbi:hypothetical protein U7230_02120 [Carboxydochorda subterranea]|uniref:PspA-associated domain-containing protein n=1 Tax=Carboxydichorda subterranea TaxID=3109565 RepID=A0ABZ1BYE6_9FIRM|nr:hypothetical protein [Limnochorda sp. L945t]WRP17830.1 hypothetical protein U7230_02120 [Limnochorda sp. L945t]